MSAIQHLWVLLKVIFNLNEFLYVSLALWHTWEIWALHGGEGAAQAASAAEKILFQAVTWKISAPQMTISILAIINTNY